MTSGALEVCLPVFEQLAVEVVLVVPVRAGQLLAPVLVRGGTSCRVRVTPRDVFREAVRSRSDGVVLAHNHLSSSGPSEADRAVTRRLVAAGVILGVPLMAHLVVGRDRWDDLVSGETGRVLSDRCALGRMGVWPDARSA